MEIASGAATSVSRPGQGAVGGKRMLTIAEAVKRSGSDARVLGHLIATGRLESVTLRSGRHRVRVIAADLQRARSSGLLEQAASEVRSADAEAHAAEAHAAEAHAAEVRAAEVHAQATRAPALRVVEATNTDHVEPPAGPGVVVPVRGRARNATPATVAPPVVRVAALVAVAALAAAAGRFTAPETQRPDDVPIILAGASATDGCDASWYETDGPTTSGEPFDPTSLTAATTLAPLGSRLVVTELRRMRSVVVRVNDFGPHVNSRCVDLTPAAFSVLADLDAGVVPVRVERLAQVPGTLLDASVEATASDS